MLTKKDVKDIMIDSLGEFFEGVMVPYMDHEHEENRKEHDAIKLELGEKIDLINEHLKNHEKRISRLEDASSVV